MLPFSSKPPVLGRGQKHRFPKTGVSKTLMILAGQIMTKQGYPPHLAYYLIHYLADIPSFQTDSRDLSLAWIGPNKLLEPIAVPESANPKMKSTT